jgi:YD repeat-containing protein
MTAVAPIALGQTASLITRYFNPGTFYFLASGGSVIGNGVIGDYTSDGAAWQAYVAAIDAQNAAQPRPTYKFVISNHRRCPIGGSNNFWNGDTTTYCFDFQWITWGTGAVVGSGTSWVIYRDYTCPRDSTLSVVYVGDHLLDVSCSVTFPDYQSPGCCDVGNPIGIDVAIKRQEEADYQDANGELSFVRTYRSDLGDFRHNYQINLVWADGSVASNYCWSGRVAAGEIGIPFCYSVKANTALANTLDLHDGNGLRKTFVVAGSTASPARRSNKDQVWSDAPGGQTQWHVKRSNSDDTQTFDASGVLRTIVARTGRTRTFTYSDASTPATVAPGPGYLIGVTDSFGRSLQLTYDSVGRLASLVEPSGARVVYAYSQFGNEKNCAIPSCFRLTSVTYQDGSVRQYLFDEPANLSGGSTFYSLLTGITDENNQRYATFKYSGGKPVSTEHAGGAARYSVSYAGGYSSTVIDPLGTSRTFNFGDGQGLARMTAVTGPACPYCAGKSQSLDANGNIASRTDFNNKKVCYAYDLTRNLETARLEGALSTEACSVVMATPPNRPDVRKITTTWNASYRLPATITEPAPGGTKTTTFTYDPSGNLTQKTMVAPKNDGTSGTTTRTWKWTYTTYGRVLTATDPDNHATTTTYYAANDPDLGKRGNVATITNAAGHVTRITAYDRNGRPLSITDPNGLVTTLAYHPRGWLTSRRVGTELTTYAYDGVGQLTKVTQADGSYVQYTYDGAHRLTQLTDGLNHKIVYTLDAMGNRIKEEAFDPSNTLSRTRQQVYDSLSRLHQSVGAQ